MKYLIYKYIKEHKNFYQSKSISQSSLNSEIVSKLKKQNIFTIYDLLTASKETIKSIFNNNSSNAVEEIDEYIFSISSDITDELDNFPPLEEWNEFLDAVNELMSINPLTCALCGEMPSAYTINLIDDCHINICSNCAEKSKNQIYNFLVRRNLW